MIQLLEALVLGMPQARDFRIFDRSWLGLFSLFQNAQNVERWDISRPVLEKKGSMFTLFRIAFQLILIQMPRNIWPLSQSHQSPTGWRGGLHKVVELRILSSVQSKRSNPDPYCAPAPQCIVAIHIMWEKVHYSLSIPTPSPSLGYLQPCPPTAPRGNHTWWWTKLVRDRTERIFLGNWHCNKNKLVVIVSCQEPWSETCSKFAKVWKLGRWLPWSPFWVGDTFWPN